ncbi:hypothetical protein [Kiloniella sp.]|uniref:hypothetical protein n=1 Tax=Kiloniella sp. TaxID=1938587 RepID=UPI003B0292E4
MADSISENPLSEISQPQIKLLLWEKLLCGAALGFLSAIFFGLFALDPTVRSPIMFIFVFCSFLSGYLVTPLLLSKDVRKPFFAFLGGGIATLVAGASCALIIFINNYDGYIGGDNEAFGLLLLIYITSVIAGGLSLLVGLLTIVLDKWLFNQRQRKDPVNPEVFE